MAIERLNQSGVTLASQIPFYDPNNGTDRRASAAELLALFSSQDSVADGFITQYAAPAASGFNVTVAPFVAGGNVFVLLTPLAAYAAGTITLPSNPTHAQKVLVHCQQAVTALTVARNGALVLSGAPTTIAAGGFFSMRYDSVTRGWYRVA